MAQPDLMPYTPAAADALLDAYLGVIMADPGDLAAHDPSYLNAKFLLKPIMDNILALIASNVGGMDLFKLWTCTSAEVVGCAVRISAADTVALAMSDTLPHSQYFAFVRSKPDATHCYLQFKAIAGGLTGGTAGNPCYLTDVGGYSATPGTFAILIGRFLNATSALLDVPLQTTNVCPRATLVQSTPQSIPNSTLTLVTFDTTVLDNDGIVTSHAMTVQHAGSYLARFAAGWDTNTTGIRYVQIFRNATVVATNDLNPTLAANFEAVAVNIEAAAGDTISAKVYQASGGALNLNSARLDLVRISAA